MNSLHLISTLNISIFPKTSRSIKFKCRIIQIKQIKSLGYINDGQIIYSRFFFSYIYSSFVQFLFEIENLQSPETFVFEQTTALYYAVYFLLESTVLMVVPIVYIFHKP